MATVFYSWQSDLPSNTNRGFIETALKKALAELAKDPDVQDSPRDIDKDTSGVAGSPDIVKEILAKICAAQVCVFDVSIVARNNVRALPNPNVMIELGYALGHHPFQKIIMVFNTATGDTKELPFDIGFKRAVTYGAPEGEGLDRSAARVELAGKLAAQLKLVFAHNEAYRFTTTEVEFFLRLSRIGHAFLDMCAEFEDRRLKPYSDMFRDQCRNTARELRDLASLDPAHSRLELLAQLDKVATGIDEIVGFEQVLARGNYDSYVATIGRASTDAVALLEPAKDAVRQGIAGHDYAPDKRRVARAALTEFERFKDAVAKGETAHFGSTRASMQRIGVEVLLLAADLEVLEDEDAKILRPAGHALHVAAIEKGRESGYREVEALVAKLGPLLERLVRLAKAPGS